MVRVLLLAGLLGTAAFGQFTNLAVTDDGSKVYFRTDLRLKAEPPSRNGGVIYRLSGGVLERLTTPTGQEPYESDANPQVSGDGTVFSYTHYQNCVGGSSCQQHPTTGESHLAVGGTPYAAALPGEAQISRNGRYVLSALVFGYTFPPRPNVVQLLDLRSHSTVDVPVRPASTRQALTGDGRILAFTSTGGLTLWSPQAATGLPVAGEVSSAIVNDDGTWVVYTRGYGTGEMRAIEISSGRDVVLTGGEHRGAGPSISNDGRLVLYLAAGQVWLVRPDGSGRRQLTDFMEGVDEAVLAGDGRVAVAVTGGRLVAVETESGSLRELIGRTPLCGLGFTALTPGSILPIRGVRMALSSETATPPLPERLGGISVAAGGRPLPLLSVSPTEIWFQAPFDLPVGTKPAVEVEHQSIFTGCAGVAAPVVERAPYFLGTAGMTVAHGDASGLVTPQAPARPGEVVTVWAVGLGAVSPEMRTGIPTPDYPLFRLSKPFECRAGYPPAGPALDVPFAGLAPSLIGVYQVNVRMPDVAPQEGYLILNCGTPDDAAERHGGVVAISARP